MESREVSFFLPARFLVLSNSRLWSPPDRVVRGSTDNAYSTVLVAFICVKGVHCFSLTAPCGASMCNACTLIAAKFVLDGLCASG